MVKISHIFRLDQPENGDLKNRAKSWLRYWFNDEEACLGAACTQDSAIRQAVLECSEFRYAIWVGRKK